MSFKDYVQAEERFKESLLPCNKSEVLAEEIYKFIRSYCEGPVSTDKVEDLLRGQGFTRIPDKIINPVEGYVSSLGRRDIGIDIYRIEHTINLQNATPPLEFGEPFARINISAPNYLGQKDFD